MKVWNNTGDVVASVSTLRALEQECEALLTADYGADPVIKLTDIHDRALRAIEPFLEGFEGDFTYHQIAD